MEVVHILFREEINYCPISPDMHALLWYQYWYQEIKS